jgi:mono/diheme cytochrome c family protein
MTHRSSLLVMLPLLSLLATGAGAALAAEAQELFVASKCVRCHSVEAQGIAAKPKEGDEDEVHDLSKVGGERTAEWIQKFLRKQETLDGKKHKQKFRGSDPDLGTLASWLASLK